MCKVHWTLLSSYTEDLSTLDFVSYAFKKGVLNHKLWARAEACEIADSN